MIIQTDNYQIERCDTTNDRRDSKADYVICRVNATEDLLVKELIEEGFHFLDRKLLFQINLLNSARSIRNVVFPNEVDLICDSSIEY